MRALALVAGVVVLALFFVNTVQAQSQGAVELGYDLGLVYQMYDQNDAHLVLAGFPVPSDLLVTTLRFGPYVSESGQLETRAGFMWADNGDGSIYTIGFGLDYLYNFDSVRAHPYVRGGGRFSVVGGGGDSDSQFGLGGGIGYKTASHNRLCGRFDFGLGHFFESDRAGHTDISFTAGLSFFTK